MPRVSLNLGACVHAAAAAAAAVAVVVVVVVHMLSSMVQHCVHKHSDHRLSMFAFGLIDGGLAACCSQGLL